MTTATVEKTTKNKGKQLLEIKPTVMLCDGNKGGVGKSFFARALYHFMESNQIPLKGVEADMESPDFLSILDEMDETGEYSGLIEEIEFTQDENKNDLANILFDITIEDKKSAVVNLNAGCHEPFKMWLDQFDALNLLPENGAAMVKFFVTSGEYDSLKSLQISLEDLGDYIPHIVIKNMKYADWDYYESEQELQELITAKKACVIDLPKLPTRIASFLLKKRMSLAEAVTYKGDRSAGERFGIAEQAAVKKFCREFGENVMEVWGQW